MGVRILEGSVAMGFGAGDALVASKVAGSGPGGIPWPVLYEAAGVAAGIFGGKVGISAEVRDTVLVSALALAGTRVTRAALAGKLMAGPKAWGGEGVGGDGDYSLSDNTPAGGYALPIGASRGIRALPGARGGGWSLYGGNVANAEAPGVAG